MIKYLAPLLLAMALVIFITYDAPPQLEKLSPDSVILALGDSLTYGTGASLKHSYPSVLQSLGKHNVVNAGIPGETSDKTLLRVKRLLSEHQPALVILCIGGNDILRRQNLRQTKQNIQQLIDVIRQQGSQVVLLGVPGFGLFPTAPDFYQALAEENQLPLDDETIPHLLRNPHYKSDQIHPNQLGYRELAQAVFTLLQEHGAL